MKLVVPLTIPSTRCTFVTTSDSRRTLITGIAAQTLASKRSWRPAPEAASKSSAPRWATSCLFAVTTCFPLRSACNTSSPVGSTPPITSATIAIDGSPRISSTSAVSTPPPGGNVRSFSRLRTSALTTRSRCPVARSMSSACSFRSRLTEAPTVPYPSRATGTSTDAMRPLDGLLRECAQPRADLLDLGRLELLAALGEARAALVHLGDPLPRERAVLDRGQDVLHVLLHVRVDDAR